MSITPRPTPSFISPRTFTPFVVHRVLLGFALLAPVTFDALAPGAGPLSDRLRRGLGQPLHSSESGLLLAAEYACAGVMAMPLRLTVL